MKVRNVQILPREMTSCRIFDEISAVIGSSLSRERKFATEIVRIEVKRMLYKTFDMHNIAMEINCV